MNLGRWQILWRGPRVYDVRRWLVETAWWLRCQFQRGQFPSRGFEESFRFWRAGLVEVRRWRLTEKERHENAGRELGDEIDGGGRR